MGALIVAAFLFTFALGVVVGLAIGAFTDFWLYCVRAQDVYERYRCYVLRRSPCHRVIQCHLCSHRFYVIDGHCEICVPEE